MGYILYLILNFIILSAMPDLSVKPACSLQYLFLVWLKIDTRVLNMYFSFV